MFTICTIPLQVRIELIKTPEDYIEAMLERAKKEYIEKTYHITSWTDHEDFLAQFAKKSGKLLKVKQFRSIQTSFIKFFMARLISILIVCGHAF